MKKIGIIGAGMVAQTLGAGFIKHGYEVMLGTHDPAKLAEWKSKIETSVSIGSQEEAANFGEMVVLAVKGIGAEEVVTALGNSLANKTVIDVTNPIANLPPENGVLKFFTTLDESLMERLQRQAPDAHFIKAFNSIGNTFMVNPDFGGTKPTMFICGDNADAKKEVSEILDQFGWEVSDMGGKEGARAIEPLCMLWCIPGFLRNEWNHVFKLVKK